MVRKPVTWESVVLMKHNKKFNAIPCAVLKPTFEGWHHKVGVVLERMICCCPSFKRSLQSHGCFYCFFPPRVPYEKKLDTFIPLEPLPQIPKWVFSLSFLWFDLWENDTLFPHGGACRLSNHGDRLSVPAAGWVQLERHTAVKGLWPLAMEGDKFYIWHQLIDAQVCLGMHRRGIYTEQKD